jgi:hypothetical protein
MTGRLDERKQPRMKVLVNEQACTGNTPTHCDIGLLYVGHLAFTSSDLGTLDATFHASSPVAM